MMRFFKEFFEIKKKLKIGWKRRASKFELSSNVVTQYSDVNNGLWHKSEDKDHFKNGPNEMTQWHVEREKEAILFGFCQLVHKLTFCADKIFQMRPKWGRIYGNNEWVRGGGSLGLHRVD